MRLSNYVLFVPEGHPIIAQRFIAGYEAKKLGYFQKPLRGEKKE